MLRRPEPAQYYPLMSFLSSQLSTGTPDMAAIRELLDTLSPSTRLTQCMALTKREQAALYDAAEGYMPIDLAYLVPKDAPPLQEVVHEGRNSLPAFRRFAKVMCRPADETNEDELWGYNRNGPSVMVPVGPGYFVAYPHNTNEVLVDYLRVPTEKPQHWPKILPNSARLSRFVYNGTQDILRGVSEHVCIGRATKGGKNMDNWFVLCRV